MKERGSTARRQGRNGPPEDDGWVPIPKNVLASITYGALGITSRRILDRLLLEWLAHGRGTNGDLVATYRQLIAFGCTGADIAKGFAELIETGFVRRTHAGLRVADGGEPARYAITFLASGKPAARTDDWKDVIKQINSKGVGDVRSAKRWLKTVVSNGRGSMLRRARATDEAP